MTDNSPTHSYEIPVSDLDLALLPPEARQVGTDAFRQAMTALIEEDFQGFSGWARIVVDDRRVSVSWRPKPEAPDPLDLAVERLQKGETRRGVQLLRLILPSRPDDRRVYHNLGMALSDLGQLDAAIACLRKALSLSPEFTEAKVALGGAFGRKDRLDDAYGALAEAVIEAPDNPYALRSLGAVLLMLKRDLTQAEAYLLKATELLPDDQATWLGLAGVLVAEKKDREAHAAFQRVLEINPASNAAEEAQKSLSLLAHRKFRSAPGGALRMDAVEYCVGALRLFEKMPEAEVRKVGFEIAALGTKGLDTSSPEKLYALRSLPESYTGLQLISMMYVAFKKIAPEADIGFDLSKEYEVALAMHREKNS